MARIRDYGIEGRAGIGAPSPQASPADFGAASGQALTRLGDAGQEAGLAYGSWKDQRDEIAYRTDIAKLRGSYAERYLQLQQGVGEGAVGFTEQVGSDFDKQAQTVLDGLGDKVRPHARLDLQNMRNDFVGTAAGFEAKSQAGAIRNNTQDALAASTNAVSVNPGMYEKAAGEARGVIDSLAIPGDMKAELWRGWESGATKARFEAMLYGSQSVEEVDRVAAELGSEPWQKRLTNAADYDSLLGQVRTYKHTLAQQNDARARVAVSQVEDRMKAGARVDPAEVAAVEDRVKSSRDPALSWKLAELKTEWSARRSGARASPSAIRQEVGRLTGQEGSKEVPYPGIPATVAAGIDRASQLTQGQISTAYLSRLALKEYGADFKKSKDGHTFAEQNPNSTAMGPYQFIESTWLTNIKDAASRYGLKIEGMDRGELLNLRSSPEISAIVAANFTMRNREQLVNQLGRDPTDGELYLAHFMGAGGAIQFLTKASSSPNAPAALDFGQAAVANPEIFHDKNGEPRSYREVFERLTASFSNNPNALEYTRAKALQDVERQQGEARKPGGDIMNYAANAGVVSLSAIDTPEGLVSRGRQAGEVAQLYEMPEPRPLTADEVEKFTNTAREGTADEAFDVITQLNQMGPKAAIGAFKQIGDKDTLFGHVAGLAGIDPSAARDVLRGRRRISDDPTSKTLLSEKGGGSTVEFNNFVGNALDWVRPSSRAAVKDAADALYVARYGGQPTFEPRTYQNAVTTVLGGSLGRVNGVDTVVPAGVKDEQFDDALGKMTLHDLSALSVSGEAPRDAKGQIVRPDEIAYEGKFKAAGMDEYIVLMGDNLPLRAGTEKDGRPRHYRMKLDKRAIDDLNARPEGYTDPVWGP